MVEIARYGRHPALPDVDLLRARFVTHRFGRHAHEGYTFGAIETGVDEFHHAGTLERAGAGAIAIVNPEVPHTGHAGVPEGWAYRAAYPSIGTVREIAADLGWSGGTPFFPSPVVDDPGCSALVCAAHRAAEGGDALAASSLMRIALGWLLWRHAAHRPAESLSRPMPAAVREVRDCLRERLVDPPSLDELAEMTGARPFTLLRAFRTAMGLPPHAYLNQLRVRRARELLDSGVPPAEVAARTGFADQAHLTRHFKRTLGVPPGAYQRRKVVARSNNVQDPVLSNS